jgi:O-antigen/teichoic acid export membrane protein
LESQASVARGATSLYVANVVVLLANTLYFLVLTNILRSTTQVGIVTSLNIVIWLLVTVCILAQPVSVQSPIPAPQAVLKFLPELLAKGSHRSAARVFKISLTSAAVIGGVIAVVLALFPGSVAPLIGGEAVLPYYIQLSAVDILILGVAQVCVGSLIALGDMRSATIYLILWSVARYTLASLLLVPYVIVGVLVGWILGDAILLIIALHKSLGRIHGGNGKANGFSVSDLTKYSLYTLFSALIGFAINQADKIFTLAQRGLQELAIYNVAIVAASFAGFAPYALVTVLLPALSALHASDKKREMRQMIRTYTRYVSIVVLPIAFGFAALTQVALRIFGPDYVAGLAPSMIVSVVTGLAAVGAVYAGVLLALGELKWYAGANVLGLASLLIVSYFLTPILGLSGPALGRASLMVLAALVYTIAVQRSGFLEIDLKAFVSAAASSTLMGVVVYVSLSFFHTFLTKLVMAPVLVVIGAMIYIGSLRALHLLTKDDVQFVQGIAPKRFQKLVPLVAKLAGVPT